MTLSSTAQALLRMLPFVLCACQVLLAVVQQLFLRTRNCQLIHFQHMWSSPVSTSSAAESSTCPTGPADYSRQSNGRQFVPQCAEGCVSDDKYKSSVYGSLAYAQVFTQYLVGTCVFRIIIQNPNNTCQSLCVPNNCVHAPVNSI